MSNELETLQKQNKLLRLSLEWAYEELTRQTKRNFGHWNMAKPEDAIDWNRYTEGMVMIEKTLNKTK